LDKKNVAEILYFYEKIKNFKFEKYETEIDFSDFFNSPIFSGIFSAENFDAKFGFLVKNKNKTVLKISFDFKLENGKPQIFIFSIQGKNGVKFNFENIFERAISEFIAHFSDAEIALISGAEIFKKSIFHNFFKKNNFQKN